MLEKDGYLLLHLEDTVPKVSVVDCQQFGGMPDAPRSKQHRCNLNSRKFYLLTCRFGCVEVCRLKYSTCHTRECEHHLARVAELADALA